MAVTAGIVAPARRPIVPGWVWLAGPYAACLLAFLLVPLINVVVLSFYTYSPILIWLPKLTLANYAAMLTPYFANVALRTLRIAATATFLCLVLGYPIAYYLARCGRHALTVGMFILTLPLMVSAVVGSFGWIVILGRNGLLNLGLAGLGIDARLSILYTESAVVIALVHYLLPLMVLPLMASIEKIPIRLEEAAINLGGSPLVTFRRVILPMSRTGMMSGIVLCFSIAISVVVISLLLGGRAGRMFGNEVYEQVITAGNWPFASALSTSLVLLIVLSIAAAMALSRGGARPR
jgi:spermidine/putrescine transport system permease protein